MFYRLGGGCRITVLEGQYMIVISFVEEGLHPFDCRLDYLRCIDIKLGAHERELQ